MIQAMKSYERLRNNTQKGAAEDSCVCMCVYVYMNVHVGCYVIDKWSPDFCTSLNQN